MAGAARDWLIEGAPGASNSEEVLAGTCERLIASGVPIARSDAYVRTLHPQFAGRAFAWQQGAVRVAETQHDREGESRTLITHTREARETQRYRFGPESPRCGYTAELAAMGVTDVISMPLVFTSGEVHVCTFATTRSGGFTDADVAEIDGVMQPLSRVAEILALRRIATNVLTAYVGRDAGARVLAGKIRRGDTELIETAIYFSDMRAFSSISSDKSPHEVIAILNQLFDCQLPAIERHGGEVLKFMGDGLLAIFPPKGGDLRACCDRALAASHDAFAALAVHNQGASIEPHSPSGVLTAGGQPRPSIPLRFGIALHVGEVAYGNIGGEARLDFTCIGRAVNLAARLEQVAAKTGREILASEAFVEQATRERFTRLGDFEVKGFRDPIAAYVPNDRDEAGLLVRDVVVTE